MHSRVRMLVHVAPVDATRSNQTISKLTNPRKKMLEGLRSIPQPMPHSLRNIIGNVEIKASLDGSQFDQIFKFS